MRKAFLLLAVVVALVFVQAAGAASHIDNFDGVILADGTVVQGPGQNTGWDGGRWIEYPQPGGDAWWNQWFYDDPPLPFPYYKTIEYTMCVEGPGFVEIAINWSTLDYNDPAMPPQPIVDEPFIVRDVVYAGGANGIVYGNILIPDYNPEWVSIDVRGQDVEVSGCIIHNCIPEPATLGLLALSAVALLRRR